MVGDADLIERIKGGWNEFDIAVATPDMMGAVGSSLGKILAQRMPNPKVGTVTQNVKQAVGEIKAGKIEYRPDKAAVIHCIIGKASFSQEALLENFTALMDAHRARQARVGQRDIPQKYHRRHHHGTGHPGGSLRG